MTATINTRDFLRAIERTGLMTHEELTEIVREFYDEAGARKNLENFARFLLEEELLTPWQVRQLLSGKNGGFFLGKYKILSQLGRGGDGAVFLAMHTVMKRQVAIKVLPRTRLKDQDELDRFLEEAQIIAKLDHPNIIRAYNVDSTGELHYLVMEYAEGQDLEKIVHDEGPLSVELATDVVRQVAEGLAYAHNKGVVHRDIKPANLFYSTQGRVKILDLGLARFADSNQPEEEMVRGSADYLAPEQARGEVTDARTDLYALGCTLFYLVTGQPPFAGASLAEVILKHQTAEPPQIADLRIGSPVALQRLFERLVAKQPEDRIGSAEELLSELDRLGEDETRVEYDETTGLSLGAISTVVSRRSNLISAEEAEELGISSIFDEIEADENSISLNLRQEYQDRNSNYLLWGGAGVAGLVLVGLVLWVGLSGHETDQAAKEDLELNRTPFTADVAEAWQPRLLTLHQAQTQLAFEQNQGGDGRIVLEAEDYLKNFGYEDQRWVLHDDHSDRDSQVFRAEWHSGSREHNPKPEDTPRLDYLVKFNRLGKHYVWVRGWCNEDDADSCYVGIDFDDPQEVKIEKDKFGTWTWAQNKSEQVSVDVKRRGWHLVTVWIREHGFLVDRILLTKNGDLNPNEAEKSSPLAGSERISPDGLQAYLQSDDRLRLAPNWEGPREAHRFVMGADGQVMIHAENYYDSLWFGNNGWKVQTRDEQKLLEIMGDDNFHKGVEANTPRVDYRIRFEQPGKYYLWLHSHSKDDRTDSCYAGIDGKEHDKIDRDKAQHRKWEWSGKRKTKGVELEVPSAGWHTLNIWMRERDFKFDRILFSREQEIDWDRFEFHESERADPSLP